MKKYLITQSLLSAWSYTHTCSEEASEEAYNDFLAYLRRVPTEQSAEMQRGISFEDAVQSYLNGDDSAPSEHAQVWCKRGCEAEEEQCVKRVAEIMQGGVYQLTAYKDKRIAGIDFLLMAKCDWVKAGVIYDSKRVSHYEPGKYYESPQHPMYFEVLDNARKFVYVVCDGEGVYTSDTYTRADIPQSIDSIITDFIADLKDMGLLETYFENWESKY